MPGKRKKPAEGGPVLAVFQKACPDYKRPSVTEAKATFATIAQAYKWLEQKVAGVHDWCQLREMNTLEEFIARCWSDGYMDNRYMSAFVFDGEFGWLEDCDDRVDAWVMEGLKQTGGRCSHPGCRSDHEEPTSQS